MGSSVSCLKRKPRPSWRRSGPGAGPSLFRNEDSDAEETGKRGRPREARPRPFLLVRLAVPPSLLRMTASLCRTLDQVNSVWSCTKRPVHPRRIPIRRPSGSWWTTRRHRPSFEMSHMGDLFREHEVVGMIGIVALQAHGLWDRTRDVASGWIGDVIMTRSVAHLALDIPERFLTIP